MFTQGAFQQNANDTPETIARKRAMIQAMMPRFGSARYTGEGIGQLATGIAMGARNRNLDKAESDGTAGAGDIFSRIMGGAGRSGGTGSGGMVNSPFSPPMPVDPNSPDAIGDDAMAALGKPMQEPDGGWMKYSNQGATRNDPIKPELVSAMSFLPEMGITMDVVSGGQEAAGEGGSRTGSTRHDHGNSADVDFYKGGRKLDWNNPDDLPLLTQVVAQAKSRGVTGIGAGDDYMGAGRFHIGFGAPAVWGAGGSSANAPSWLAEAYNGAPTGQAPQSAPAQDLAPLYEAMANPFMSQEQRAVLTQMIQQGEQQADPGYQMGLEKQRMELDQMRNPQADPMDAIALEQAQLNLDQDRTGAGSDVPSGFQTLDLQAQAAGFAPGTPEYQQFMQNGGGSGTPAAFTALDMQAQAAGLTPGTKEYQQFMATRGAGLQAEARAIGTAQGEAIASAPTQIANGEIAIQGIDEIRNHEGMDRGTGMSSIGNGVFGTKGYAFQKRVEQLAGGAFLTAIQQLQGMGALSNSEGQTATAALARLQTGLSREEFEDALADYEQIVKGGMERAQGRINGQAAPATVPQFDDDAAYLKSLGLE